MFRLLFIFTLAACVAMPCDPATAQQPALNLTKLFDGIDLRRSDSTFIAPPREIIRPLLRCKKLMASGEVTEAVEILGELLADDSSEDFLISRGSRFFSSLRTRTESILGSIDSRYLEPYQVRYGIRARKLLERGLEENDLSLLQKASNQFFFTDSGAEAAMLLGHMELSNGQPSAAQSWFAKIVRFPSTAAKHDPEASVLLATCQLLGNNRRAAKATLVSLKQRMPRSTIEVMGENYTLFNADKEAISWLTTLIGDSPLASGVAVNKWLMFQGNPSRTGKTGTGMPLLAARWEHQTSDSLPLQKASRAYIESLINDNAPPAPAVQPLVVGDTIVFRGYDQMFGVDSGTGLRKWSWPPQLAWNEKPKTSATAAETEKINQRMVMDSIYGRASSDGELIFFVPDPGSSNSGGRNNNFANATQSNPEDLRTYNEIAAIDAESSGLLRWRVGGPNGFDEPRLAKVYFMGEPLPLEGVLYCCCVRDNAIQLVALDAKTGKLRWSQAIAAYSSTSFDSNHSRRLAGVTPSYADGKLVCLTGTGGVVALEVSTRSLIWGHEYRPPKSTSVVSDEKSTTNVLTDTWRDSQVTISNGMVFLTPVLSRQLICLDLDDGGEVWFEEDGFLPTIVNRKSSLYLAGINKDKLILVGARDVRAIDSFSGTESWKLELDVDDLPSGRGYIGDDSLIMPTTSRKILRIDLINGKVAESVGTSRVLGNLSRVKDDVVSHGVDHVASFPEFRTTKKFIESLPAGELNEEQQFLKLQTMIQQGDLEAGLEMLISLASENDKPRYSVLLNSCATNFGKDNPALSLKALDALKRIYPEFDVRELERLRMLSKIRTGEFRESLDLGLDQLEESFAEYCGGDGKDTSSKIVKGISAPLLDRPDEVQPDPPPFKGIEAVEFDNRYEKIQYSQFGWQRTRLQMAIEGLQKKNPDAVDEVTQRVAKLISNSIELPQKQLLWLVDRLPMVAFNSETLEVLAKHFLEKGEHLKSLMFANAAIRRGGKDVDQFKLLKSEIMFAGRDLRFALVALDEIDIEKLDNANTSRLEQLRKEIADAKESSASNLRAATNWITNDSANVNAGVSLNSEHTKQKPTRYRIPFEFSASTDPSYYALNLFICPWGEKKDEFELRNSRGNLVRKMRLRDEKTRASYGYTTKSYIDIQNHTAELQVNKLSLYVDWFKILAGEDGNLWKLPMTATGELLTAFSGDRHTIVGREKLLHCYDTLTGKLVWKRSMTHTIKRVVTHGSRLTVWSETGRQFNTFEAETGRLVKTSKSNRFIVSRCFGEHFVLEHPIRKGELPAEQEKALLGNQKPKNASRIANRLAVFKASTGQIVWETIVNPKSKQHFRYFDFGVLDPNGKLSIFNLKDGSLMSEVDLPLTAVEHQALKSFHFHRHSAGWIVHVRCRDRADRFSRGKTSYSYTNLHGGLGSGPVYLLDESRKQLIWKSPIYIERMEYLKNQPFDSPVIMFGRHVERRQPIKGESHFMQTICVDCKSGRLVGHQMMKTLESYDGHAIEWEQSKPSGPFDTLTISTAAEVQKIRFGQDAELPPLPSTHVTFNAMDFFDDPIFEEAKGEVIDIRVDEFRNRAAKAAEKREENQSTVASELKKRLKVKEVK